MLVNDLVRLQRRPTYVVLQALALMKEHAPQWRVLATLKKLPQAGLASSVPGSALGFALPRLVLPRMTAVASSEHFFGQPIFVYEVMRRGNDTAPVVSVEENRYGLSQGAWCW